MSINDGGPAFPDGMSIRDYFAAHALGLLRDRINNLGWAGEIPIVLRESLARDCYMMADAMLEARERKVI